MGQLSILTDGYWRATPFGISRPRTRTDPHRPAAAHLEACPPRFPAWQHCWCGQSDQKAKPSGPSHADPPSPVEAGRGHHVWVFPMRKIKEKPCWVGRHSWYLCPPGEQAPCSPRHAAAGMRALWHRLHLVGCTNGGTQLSPAWRKWDKWTWTEQRSPKK